MSDEKPRIYYDTRTTAEIFIPAAKFREDAARIVLAGNVCLGQWPDVDFKIGLAATPEGLAALQRLSDADARSIERQVMSDLCIMAERLKININDALAGRTPSKVHPDLLPAVTEQP